MCFGKREEIQTDILSTVSTRDRFLLIHNNIYIVKLAIKPTEGPQCDPSIFLAAETASWSVVTEA